MRLIFHLYSREQWKAMTMWVLHCAFTYFVSAWSKHGYAHAVTAKISLEEIKQTLIECNTKISMAGNLGIPGTYEIT